MSNVADLRRWEAWYSSFCFLFVFCLFFTMHFYQSTYVQIPFNSFLVVFLSLRIVFKFIRYVLICPNSVCPYITFDHSGLYFLLKPPIW